MSFPELNIKSWGPGVKDCVFQTLNEHGSDDNSVRALATGLNRVNDSIGNPDVFTKQKFEVWSKGVQQCLGNFGSLSTGNLTQCLEVPIKAAQLVFPKTDLQVSEFAHTGAVGVHESKVSEEPPQNEHRPFAEAQYKDMAQNYGVARATIEKLHQGFVARYGPVTEELFDDLLGTAWWLRQNQGQDARAFEEKQLLGVAKHFFDQLSDPEVIGIALSWTRAGLKDFEETNLEDFIGVLQETEGNPEEKTLILQTLVLTAQESNVPFAQICEIYGQTEGQGSLKERQSSFLDAVEEYVDGQGYYSRLREQLSTMPRSFADYPPGELQRIRASI